MITPIVNLVPNSIKFKIATAFRNPAAKAIVTLVDLGAGQLLAYLTNFWPDFFAYLDSEWHINHFTIGLIISYGLLQLWNTLIVRFLTDDVKDLQIDINQVLSRIGDKTVKVDGGMGKETKQAVDKLVQIVNDVVTEANSEHKEKKDEPPQPPSTL